METPFNQNGTFTPSKNIHCFHINAKAQNISFVCFGLYFLIVYIYFYFTLLFCVTAPLFHFLNMC